MTSIETKGKSVDEAIFNGLNQLGVGIDEVDIDIIHEGSRGFFGLGKNAVVRLTIKEEEPEETFSPAVEAIIDNEIPAAEMIVPPAELDEEEPGLRMEAREFLENVFSRMGVVASCKVKPLSENHMLEVNIEGKDTAALIGRRGETLDALQYLTGLVINRHEDEYIRVVLDAENYREKREETLQKLARRLANNVIRYGKPVRLEPMNPYERRILHATLQDNPKVETYSEGTDPYRRVVIRRKRRS